MAGPHAHIRLDFSAACAVGPGKIALLEAIARTGSLSAAARALGMSYRRGWLLVHSVNEGFASPLVELNAGGRDGGGARLTPPGEELVARYRAFEAEVEAIAARSFAGLRPARRLPEAAAADPRATRRPVSRRLGPSAD
jgi:molybdate transport system regulatory protein